MTSETATEGVANLEAQNSAAARADDALNQLFGAAGGGGGAALFGMSGGSGAPGILPNDDVIKAETK